MRGVHLIGAVVPGSFVCRVVGVLGVGALIPAILLSSHSITSFRETMYTNYEPVFLKTERFLTDHTG